MLRRLCIHLLLAGLFAGAVLAQTVSGFISGTVTDPSGGIVANAKITLTSDADGGQRDTLSNEAGVFAFTSVQPGSYALQIQEAGFKTFRQTNLILRANERLPVNVKLELGAMAELVRVEAHGATVQTASAERSGTVTSAQLETLQLKGRDYMGTIRLLPGVVDIRNRDAPGFGSQNGIAIQGQTSMNVTLDGVTSQDAGSANGNFFAPSMDSVSEVNVLLTNYQAEYGRNSGATINVVLKSGGKDFHGGVYEYKRNEALNANNFFNNTTGVKRARYRYDIFGYTLGGPVYVPGLIHRTKDKLFFFWSHEISPQNSPQPLAFRTVPTAVERQGDFSQTLLSNGRLQVVTDPTTGQAFPGNLIPSSRIDKNGQAILNIFPAANIASPTRQFNYVFQSLLKQTRNVETLRVDYALTSKTRMFWRGIRSAEAFTGDQGFTGISSNWPQTRMRYSIPGHGSVMNVTTVVSPRTVNEFTWGINRGFQSRSFVDEAALARNQRSKIGLGTLGQFYPRNNPLDYVPDASFGGVPNAVNLRIDPQFPFLGTANVWNFTDNLSHVRGSHTLKTGIYFEPTARNARREALFRGSFDFGASPNNPLDTGWAWSNAMLGNFQSYEESDSLTFGYGRFKNLEGYVQDSWKVSRRLTLDLGLRLAWIQPIYSEPDNLAGFVSSRYDPAKAPLLYRPGLVGATRVGVNPLTGATVPAVLIGAFVPGSGNPYNGMVVVSQDKSYPRGLIDDRGVQYGPRAGFAYDVFGTGKTAVRGGFGIFYDRILAATLIMAQNPPLRNTPIVYYSHIASYLRAQQSQFPAPVNAVSKSGEVPSVKNWSFGVQQAVGFGTVLDVAYVGSVGRHLSGNRNINLIPYGANFQPANLDPTSPGRPLPASFLRPYPGYGDITLQDFSSSSNFHSMQVQANRRFARSMQYGVAWTWSKTMGLGGSIATYAPVRVWNYGKTGPDRTHNLVFSYTWDVPKASPRWNNFLTRQVLDNWQLSGIASFISGQPLGIGMTTTDNADIAGGGDGVRTVVLQNPVLPKGDRTFERFFNTQAFARPARGTFGNAPVDVIRGPGINNWDVSISKRWNLGSEKRRLQLRVEMYNAWNHTQFSALDTTARFAPDGSQTNARFGQLTAAYPGRQVQIGLRFMF
jgi:hypothetical protein